jgi:hypothetical protein
MKMTKKITFLMCSPRGDSSASHAIGSYVVEVFEEKGYKSKYIHVYKTLRKQELIDEMVDSINESEIILLSTPLYIDSAPANTIRLMDTISAAVEEEKITKKKRYLITVVCAGFLEYYHNLLALRMYEQFAKINGFTWAGGLPIGAAGTYTLYGVTGLIEKIAPLPKEDIRHKIYAEPAKILVEVINAAVENLALGNIIPEEELKKLEVLSMPMEMYVEGGNQNWIDWAERIDTVDKLRDKPYEK